MAIQDFTYKIGKAVRSLFGKDEDVEKVEKELKDLQAEFRQQRVEQRLLKEKVEELESKDQKTSPNEEVVSDNAEEPQTEVSEEVVGKSAKEAIIENIQVLEPMLQSLLDDTFDGSKWDDSIVELDSKELNSLWPKLRTRPDALLRMLSVWNIRPEYCSAFVCTGKEGDLYAEIADAELVVGTKYEVVSNSWLATEDDGSKKVIIKGRVKISN